MKVQQVQSNINFEAKKPRYLDYESREQLTQILRKMDEETVYKSEKPIAAKDYNKTMQTIYQQYPGVKETMDLIIGYDVFEYVQKVALLYPGYYLNYATSEIVAMNLHTTAMLEGYEVAQDAYVSLMSMDALELNLSEAVALVGLDSPFVEETFISLQQVLLPNTNN